MMRSFKAPAPFMALLLVASVLIATARGEEDERVGYYIPSGATEASVASCDFITTAVEQWSTVGSIGVCVLTEASSRGTSTSPKMTTNYFVGKSCDGSSSLTGHYIASADSRTVSITVHVGCYRDCATVTVFQTSPSGLPSASFIGCPELLGLPPEARTVYRELPRGITTVASSPPVDGWDHVTTKSPTSTSTSTETETTTESTADTSQTTSSETETSTQTGTPNGTGSDRGENGQDNSSNNTPVIVGAVVGSVGGIALIALAFFLGRRFAASRKSTVNNNTTIAANPGAPPPNPYQGKPELEGTLGVKPSHASYYTTSTLTPDQGAWAGGQGPFHPQQQQQQFPQYPPQQQYQYPPQQMQASPSTTGTPYDVPGAYQHQQYHQPQVPYTHQ
ncbi:hypothetical protein B0J18DRAFT_237376 [Chaetomium sp. MPI-SDFR-AT-0129]|nr:hypothetical protein B0J18DRAFT_237376 [Chaetomium sp. MPI-SDFR-AT-0129]